MIGTGAVDWTARSDQGEAESSWTRGGLCSGGEETERQRGGQREKKEEKEREREREEHVQAEEERGEGSQTEQEEHNKKTDRYIDKMPVRRFVQIGRVCLVHRGENEGKLVMIVDIIDQNRVLVDWTDLERQQV